MPLFFLLYLLDVLRLKILIDILNFFCYTLVTKSKKERKIKMQIVKKPEIILTKEEKEVLKEAVKVFTGIAEWIDEEMEDTIEIQGETYKFETLDEVIDLIWKLVEE